MPLVRIDLREGRSGAQIEELHRRVAEVVAEIAQVNITQVRTYITQFPPSAWGIGGVTSPPSALQPAPDIPPSRLDEETP